MKQKSDSIRNFVAILTVFLILILSLANFSVVFAEQGEAVVLLHGLNYPVGVAVDKN